MTLPLESMTREEIRSLSLNDVENKLQETWAGLVADLPYVLDTDTPCGFDIRTYVKPSITDEQRNCIHQRELQLYDVVKGLGFDFRVVRDYDDCGEEE